MKKFLYLLLATVIVFNLSACSSQTAAESEPLSTEAANHNVDHNALIVYFSRYGNTEFTDDVDATTSASIIDDGNRSGTTEVLARIIQSQTGSDLYAIHTEESYPADFDTLREQNHQEQNNNAHPTLESDTIDLDNYDTLFIGYPVWASDVPRAVVSFLEMYNLSDKAIVPFCTHDGYGPGNSYDTIAATSGTATVLNGLAVAADNITNAESEVREWLQQLGYIDTTNTTQDTDLHIQVGTTTLAGILYDTPLAREIASTFPLSVEMVSYGDREYYGSIDFTPSAGGEGQRTFQNGNITYCPTNNTLAIFYAQTDHPDLTMDVIPIGHVTSDLSVFSTLDNRTTITFSLANEAT